jgi:hypothetical protein
VVAGVALCVAPLQPLLARRLSTTTRGSAYYADSIEHGPAHLYFDDVRQVLARYPDSGFLYIDADNVDSTLFCAKLSTLPSPSGWIGSTLVARTIQWRFRHRSVVSVDAAGGRLVSRGGAAPDAGWGFFLQGSPAGLSVAGEWASDTAAGVLLFVPPKGLGAAQLQGRVRVSVYAQGIQLTRNVVANELSFFGFSQNAIGLTTDGQGGVVQDCSVRECATGVSGSRVNGARIEGSDFENVYATGLSFWNCARLQIKNNSIRGVGLDPGVEGWYFGIALSGAPADIPLWNVGHRVSGNRIARTGYSGVTHTSGDGAPANASVLEHNVIDSVCMTVADGGGIYTGYSHGDTIRHNVITHGYGNALGWNYGQGGYRGDRYVFGIDLMGDFDSLPAARASTYHHNVIAHFEAGLFCNRDIIGVVANDNLIYGSRRADVLLKRRSGQVANPPNRFTNNILYSFGLAQPSLNIVHLGNPRDEKALGHFEGNYYGNPYAVRREPVLSEAGEDGLGDIYYSAAQWHHTFGQEPGGVQHAPFEAVVERSGVLYRPGDTLGGSLLGEGDFEASLAGWVGQGGALSREYRPEHNSTALVFVNDTTQFYSRCISPGPLALRVGALYRLRFTMASAVAQRVGVFVANRSSAFGDGQLVTPTYSFISSPWGNSYDMVFEPDSAGAALYLHFRLHKSQGPLYLDVVSLHEVSRGAVVLPHHEAPLFVNTSDHDSALVLPGAWRTLGGALVSSPLLLKAHEGVVLRPDVASNPVSRWGGGRAAVMGGYRLQRSDGRGVQLQGLSMADAGARVRLITLNGRVEHSFTVTAQMAQQGWVVLPAHRSSAAGLLVIELRGGGGNGTGQRVGALMFCK